ncbi:glycosyltransferase [Rhizobiaceae bacterium n13]|uniref:Glycosyltransferase n=1 Tax=Ferirhizobium litorale TaxID=2927786 RepID=A0AAE3U3R3_9HYPH|nr:glycosyltransferase family 2 protein [Fererhizobium litorale]MDI7862065.1 glycosyltransferase [Fererhizobium litorale]MDI7922663.1 glycosyltransferase [Fererhizobium litorale]
MTTQSPDVSFVVAAYNASDTISATIESALAQQGVSLEVVVVDDCSSDNTRARVREFADARVRLIELESNRGPGGARNAGIAAARGRWIAVLDSDDTLHPPRTARMIERARRTGAQIVVDNVEVVSLDGNHRRMFSQRDLAKRAFLDLPAFIESNVLFRSRFNFGYMKPIYERRFLEEQSLSYVEALRIGEDYILLASALARGGRCAIEPSAGYVYNIREGSISRVLELRHVDAMIAADTALLREHVLDRRSLKAQRLRDRSLAEARAFLKLVTHLKSRSWIEAARIALRHPSALKHLAMPIAARVRRITARLASIKPAALAAAPDKPTPGKGPHISKG